ncbi:hypothetical protein JW711_02675 [Candidatus Woesearchaeota archaeon]|nr:hypothetical protein [Candidatus Woesearchaeota archaeon]
MARRLFGAGLAALMVVCIAFTLIAAHPASARNYDMTLLTVGESGDEEVGGTAKAYLEIMPGSGRIFLDSFPLTKLDTQISTRYANQIACDYLEMDCSKKDFFYTIRADSTIVGGPSASASLTVLTIAALKGLELKNDTVMTGTINSGGSIGPVGGISQKTLAAQEAGFTRVLIPKFSIPEEQNDSESNDSNPIIKSIQITTTKNSTANQSDVSIIVINQSTGENININNINISENPIFNGSNDGGEAEVNQSLEVDLSNLTIEVIPVTSLEEALLYFFDSDLSMEDGGIIVPEEYTATMRGVAESLCQKAYSLKSRVSLDEEAQNMTLDFERKINSSFAVADYYSAASFCFNLGVNLRKINIHEVEESHPERLDIIRAKTLEAVLTMDGNLENRSISTLSELESYIIVKERVIESKNLLEEMNENISADDLAYAIERYYSAVYWSKFFDLEGKPVKLEQSYLEEACVKKISEAEERLKYANIYLPLILRATRNDVDAAYEYAREDNFKMCLFKASYAKAEANLLLSSMSLGTGRVSDLAQEKLKAAEKVIAKESRRGFFPIMGYSYYEYANSLNANKDAVSSLIFSEYTLELSNLEMYFPKKETFTIRIRFDLLVPVLFSFIVGLLVGLAIMSRSSRKRRVAASQARPLKKSARKRKR